MSCLSQAGRQDLFLFSFSFPSTFAWVFEGLYQESVSIHSSSLSPLDLLPDSVQIKAALRADFIPGQHMEAPSL